MSSGKNHIVKWCSLCLLLLITLLAACSTSTLTSSSPASHKPTPALSQAVASPTPQIPTSVLSPTVTGPTAPGLKNCQPASPIDNSSVGPEVQGTAINAELWALIMSTSGVPPLANTQVKIVWRMTNSDYLDLVALGPHGMRVPPAWGPDRHMGSNWSRPGGEWGSGFTFPMAGCWDLHATSNNAFGDVWLKIVG